MILLAAALACVDCHRDLVERYARTPMANTSGRVRAADESAGKVGRQFTITPGLQLLWPGGRANLTFFIGSRRMGRSFAYEYKSHLYQAPVNPRPQRARLDKRIEFDAKIGRLKFTQPFFVDEMMYQGKLEM